MRPHVVQRYCRPDARDSGVQLSGESMERRGASLCANLHARPSFRLCGGANELPCGSPSLAVAATSTQPIIPLSKEVRGLICPVADSDVVGNNQATQWYDELCWCDLLKCLHEPCQCFQSRRLNLLPSSLSGVHGRAWIPLKHSFEKERFQRAGSAPCRYAWQNLWSKLQRLVCCHVLCKSLLDFLAFLHTFCSSFSASLA